MQFAAIETALVEWVSTITSLPTYVENQARGHQIRVNGFVVISPPDNIVPIGEDYNLEPPGVDPLFIVPTLVGRREFTVVLKAISRSQTAGRTGRHWIEKLRESLKKPSTLDFFRESELAIVRMGRCNNFDAPFDDRMESIAVAELRLSCAVTDTDAPIGTIETVIVSSTLQDPGGTVLPVPPNLDDQVFSVEE